MKIIFGLGNPGREYQNTRHNAGFLLLDYLKEKLSLEFIIKDKLYSSIAKYKFNDKIIFVKPQTFMNNSGRAVYAIIKYYKIIPENTWIIHDDIDLHLGKYRISFNSGSAGHKGVQSIIDYLKTTKFNRLRLGIFPKSKDPSKPEEKKSINTEKFVLENFTKKEKEIFDETIEKAADEILTEL